ncbi:M42 family metallopeptidase [Acidaminobacter sp. JC074]|uniref:M42 family metallopeptidase n=1 Tax=Acidaminobacter sp. JC074 TaxID=2530199 RepID=UPI001F0E4ADA|nr:M42 family metallopeptidase [Acidaminobacter sp. JC074]MCH4890900.1 M42 family metallopeptidase [Acidaminobacter sp. JC074]
MEINKKYIMDSMVTLLTTPSPTGDTEAAIDFVDEKFKGLGIETRRTVKNALIATIPGEDDSKHRLLSAHVDTLGAMVKEIKANGRLKVTQIGGYAWNSIEGEYCTISTDENGEFTGTILLSQASTHVHGGKVGDQKRTGDNIEIRIDEKVKNKKDVEDLGIQVGDFVYLDTRTDVTESGFVKSRHLDDKACVACLLGMAEHLVTNKIKPKYTTHFYISNYEEVGHGSSAAIPEKTFEFLAVDMAAPGDGQTSTEYAVTICAKDSSGPYDLEMKRRLAKLAKDNELDYVIDIYPFYGSDASAALRAGWEVKHGLIGPGVDASHSYERLHEDSIEATVKLGILYITN